MSLFLPAVSITMVVLAVDYMQCNCSDKAGLPAHAFQSTWFTDVMCSFFLCTHARSVCYLRQHAFGG